MFLAATLPAALACVAQNRSPGLVQNAPSTPIGSTRASEVSVSGAIEVRNGALQLGNGSTITAADKTVDISLIRGGRLRLCSTTSVHLSRDRSIDAPDSTALMIALDRGALEANYDAGKYSDVVLTPDLRMLISGPGHADLQIRVSRNGDTCVNNPGANAPYITVTSLLDGGLYRIQPGQHVSFQHGSLREVVDTETEPCGCPPAAPATSVAGSGTAGAARTASGPAAGPQPARAVGGPSSTPADTEFPLSVSEGLQPPPPSPQTPVAAPGEVHAQVVVPFEYNAASSTHAAPVQAAPLGNRTDVASPAPAQAPGAGPTPIGNAAAATAVSSPAVRSTASAPNLQTSPAAAPAPTAAPVPSPAPSKPPSRTKMLLHRVGRFFSKVFGAE